MKAESLKDKVELDPEEKRRITSAEKLFTEMQKEIDNVRFTKQLRGQTMIKIIEDIIGNKDQ
jgi:restriction endonuclease